MKNDESKVRDAGAKLPSFAENRGTLARREFLKLAVAGVTMTAFDWRLWAVDEGLPPYYGDYLAKIAARLDELSKTCDDAFFFITDLHIPSNRCVSGRILAKLVAETRVKKVLCGGDMPEAFGGKPSIDRTITAYREQWVRAVEGGGGEFYPAKGNHDFTIRDSPSATFGHTCSGKEAHDILMDTAAVKANAVTNPDDPEACYYYFDTPGRGIRYIVADTTDSIRADRTYWAVKYGMGERQLTWLAENALMTLPAGWVALVMHHIPVTEIVSGEKDVPRIFEPWRKLLEAYQSRGIAAVGGRKFDFACAQGRILCSLTGHEHAERQTFQNGVWHITEPCDAAYSDYIVGSAPWCADLPKKEKGTVFEQTFDAIHIDRKNNMLHFTRIGGGSDRIVRLAAQTLDAGATLSLASAGDTYSWGCYDADRAAKMPNPANKYQSFFKYFNDVAEISQEGILRGKRRGEAVAIATSMSGRKTILPVAVREPGMRKFRVGTYNIRFTTGDVGTENAWEERRADMIALIRKLDMDVFGLQEMRPEQEEFLRKELPDYGYVGDYRGANRRGDEASPVFYRKNRFDMEKSGTFWLSESPDVPGVVGWGAMCPRVCSYAILREKESGKRLAFANTHTDHYSALAREKGMLLIIERMKEFGEGAPIVFTGDHNCRETEVPAQAVAKMLRNALYESETPPTGPWRTFNGWKWLDSEIATLDALRESPEERNAPERACRIDYIYVSPGVHVLDYATVADVRRGLQLYPSDHFPIVSTIEI